MAEDIYLSKLIADENCPKTIKAMNLSLVEYNDLIARFRVLNPIDRETAYQMTLEAIAWQDWFASVRTSLGYLSKSIGAEKDKRTSVLGEENGAKSVARAEQIAQMDPLVIKMTRQRAITDAIYDMLGDKIKILEKVFYLCRAIATDAGAGDYGGG